MCSTVTELAGNPCSGTTSLLLQCRHRPTQQASPRTTLRTNVTSVSAIASTRRRRAEEEPLNFVLVLVFDRDR
jgi:hypothetical protein